MAHRDYYYGKNNYEIPATRQDYFLKNYGRVLGEYNNVTRDYNIAQGVSHPSDLSNHILRDINIRYVTVENSSPENFVGIAVTDAHYMTPIPPIKFSLAPGEIKHLGINTIGEPMQYIHMLNLRTGLYLGDPQPFRTDANQFVLRDGINKWFVDTFHRPSYNAAH